MISPRAYVLAGGRSSRFGSDKARALFEGVPLVVRSANSLAPFSRREVSVVARRPGEYSDLGLRTIADAVPGLGPLGGIEAALRDAARGWTIISSCDRVLLEPAWVRTLLAEAGRSSASAVAFRGDAWEPLPACYHSSLAADVAAALGRGVRAMQRYLDRVAALAIELPGDWSREGQVNTREELQKLDRPG